MPSEHDREAVDEASSPSSAGQFVAKVNRLSLGSSSDSEGERPARNGCPRADASQEAPSFRTLTAATNADDLAPSAFSGAEAHVSGTCRPCVFHPSAVGCSLADRCCYCHESHVTRRSSVRGIRKHTRERIKERVLPLLAPPRELDAVREQLQLEALRHPWARRLIHKCLEKPPDQLQ
ncbi:unnamed protein product [Durusdinium trenchii]|uniref:C3H1-type domain-containing protein n=1 Tax=Durusdinium trenchii TaxID=1381693 RepID=A0ABP0Q5V6_9DINO